MKFEFELTLDDYKKAYLNLLKRQLLNNLFFFLGLIIIISCYCYYFTDYKLANYVSSFFSLLILILIVGIIPAYLNYKRSLKTINSNSEFFGKKSFELTYEGLKSTSENSSSYYRWKDIKQIYSTKKYGFVILINKKSILFRNDNRGFIQKLKEFKKKYSSK